MSSELKHIHTRKYGIRVVRQYGDIPFFVVREGSRCQRPAKSSEIFACTYTVLTLLIASLKGRRVIMTTTVKECEIGNEWYLRSDRPQSIPKMEGLWRSRDRKAVFVVNTQGRPAVKRKAREI